MPERLEDILRAHPVLAPIVDRAAEHRFQVLIARAAPGGGQAPGGGPASSGGPGPSGGADPRFEQQGFRVDAEYFYPASTVKLIAAIGACLKVQELQQQGGEWAGVDLDTPMRIHAHPADPSARVIEGDATNRSAGPDSGKVTLGHEIRKLFLVSDNPAYNRLIDFAGLEYLNRAMWEVGLSSLRLQHRFDSALTVEDQLISPAIEFEPRGSRAAPRLGVRKSAPIATLALGAPPAPTALTTASFRESMRLGEAHLLGRVRVESPMDFTFRNRCSLRDLQLVLMKLARPDLATPGKALALSASHRAFLLGAMALLPGDSENPIYQRERYADDFGKFLSPGLRRAPASGRDLVIHNKVGQAFGFTLENAHLFDPASGRSVFVSACLYTNANRTLNDDTYEYREIALPAFAALGEVVAHHFLGAP